ncbi:MAG: VacJ family lipoprotein, partial [Deltaproteobacteria bacterium]|nr:VacJ family lipoprotein [Deltaproteobacteria bacterium]
TRRQAEDGAAASGTVQEESGSSAARRAPPAGQPSLDADELDEYPDVPQQAIADPFETWNRFWFSFNDVFYSWLLQPVYKGYAFVTPEGLRVGLKNVLTNALFPVRFVNSLLQGKFLAAGVELSRFIVNSTVGLGGFINVTRDRKTIVPVDPAGADFGQTLGVWGFDSGPYLVLPILGPSSVRETVGHAGDFLMDPMLFVPGSTTNTSTAYLVVWGGLRFNAAGETLDTYESIKKIAVNPYIGMRDMFAKHRQNRVKQALAPVQIQILED